MMVKRRFDVLVLAVCSFSFMGCGSPQSVSVSTPESSVIQTSTQTSTATIVVLATVMTAPDLAIKRLNYDAAKNTLTLQSGAWSLPEVSAQASTHAPNALREMAKGEWLLRANLVIGKGASLRIAGPDVAWLKLASGAAGFIWLKALGGDLNIQATKITSWDTEGNALDENTEDGRSFVLARNGSHMSILNSEMSYLGYFAAESYGVAWRNVGTAGQAINSKFGYNFYGLYAHEASGLIIRGNEVHHSVRYGIDPHTRSNKLLIENNVSHHNGKQGIILAEECSDSVIRNNTVYSNTLHGIVIYQRSNNNLVEGNVSYGNNWQGINVNDSVGNIVRNNTVYGNGKSGLGIGENVQLTQIVSNTLRENAEHGIYFYSASTANTVTNNIISNNALNGIYIKSAGNLIGTGNDIFGNRVGVLQRVANPQDLSTTQSRIHDNTEADTQLGKPDDSGQAATETP